MHACMKLNKSFPYKGLTVSSVYLSLPHLLHSVTVDELGRDTREMVFDMINKIWCWNSDGVIYKLTSFTFAYARQGKVPQGDVQVYLSICYYNFLLHKRHSPPSVSRTLFRPTSHLDASTGNNPALQDTHNHFGHRWDFAEWICLKTFLISGLRETIL